jgi:hypothetical protein
MQFQLGAGLAAHSSETLDISFAGLSFMAHIPINAESRIHITVGLKERAYDLRARVAYSAPQDDGRYRIGVSFLDPKGNFRRELTEVAIDDISG